MPARVRSAQPDMVKIVQGAFVDAWPIVRSRIFVYGLLAGIGALAGLAVPFVHLADANAQEQWQFKWRFSPPISSAPSPSFLPFRPSYERRARSSR